MSIISSRYPTSQPSDATTSAPNSFTLDALRRAGTTWAFAALYQCDSDQFHAAGDWAAAQGRGRPRVPGRRADYLRWCATWELILRYGWHRKRVKAGAIAERLAEMHPESAYSADIIADILRAGAAGLLGLPP